MILFEKLTDEQLIAAYRDIYSGGACGCPICCRNLLDVLAPRFRQLVAERTHAAAPNATERVLQIIGESANEDDL